MNAVSTRTALLLSGAATLLLWLALPGGGGLWPLLAVACVPLFVSVWRGSRRQAIGCTLFFGVGHFLLQLYWIVFVLGQYGGLPLFASVPALVALSLYMTGYLLIFVLLARLFIARFSPLVSLWLIPGVWVGQEWLRSVWITGFPWMDLGYGFADVPLMFQSADIFGHYGLSFLIVLLNTLFALLILNRAEIRLLRQRVVLVLPVCAVFLVTALYSGWRWQQLAETLAGAESMNVAVVQGNIDQKQKWNPARQGSTVRGYVTQSQLLMEKTPLPDLLVWPETSLPFYPVDHPLLAPIVELVSNEQVMLLTGAPWYERNASQPENIKFFNSSLLFNMKGEIVARTSKSQLVPFGEYVPFKRFIPFVAPLVEAIGDFSRGEISNPPACKKARIGVLICFESIFADISRKWVNTGANLLVNITNDSWYGKSSAPYQTIAMTRLRAVETRRSIVRSANTGFSGFIDPLGRLQKISPLFVPWEATGQVQLMEERTVFVRGGYLFAPLCFVLGLLGLVIAKQKKMKFYGTVKE